MNLLVTDLSFRIQNRRLLEAIRLDVRKGEFVGLIGPNGSGKSTLLKQIYRVLEPQSGGILLQGQDLLRMPVKETARQIAVVGQESVSAFDFTVRELVMMGRIPHKRLFEPDTKRDRDIVAEALSCVGLLHAAGSRFSALSGGEKQRVWIARALAQQARLLLLDEPTNHLDVRYQLQMMELVKTLKLTCLAALHDLNIAACYCDRIYVLKEGRIAASGRPEQVLRPDLLYDVFGVTTDIAIHPATGKPSITFLPERLAGRRERGPSNVADSMHLL